MDWLHIAEITSVLYEKTAFTAGQNCLTIGYDEGQSAVFALLNERLTVDALTLSRVRLVCRDLHAFQSAVILALSVVLALLYRAFDRGVGGLVFHFL